MVRSVVRTFPSPAVERPFVAEAQFAVNEFSFGCGVEFDAADVTRTQVINACRDQCVRDALAAMLFVDQHHANPCQIGSVASCCGSSDELRIDFHTETSSGLMFDQTLPVL